MYCLAGSGDRSLTQIMETLKWVVVWDRRMSSDHIADTLKWAVLWGQQMNFDYNDILKEYYLYFLIKVI